MYSSVQFIAWPPLSITSTAKSRNTNNLSCANSMYICSNSRHKTRGNEFYYSNIQFLSVLLTKRLLWCVFTFKMFHTCSAASLSVHKHPTLENINVASKFSINSLLLQIFPNHTSLFNRLKLRASHPADPGTKLRHKHRRSAAKKEENNHCPTAKTVI